MIQPTKRPKAIWTKTFPDQLKKLHPERGFAGGIKSRSQPKAVRDAVYNAINELFAKSHPFCECCCLIWPDPKEWAKPHLRDDTHHTRGKDGILYFDVRWFRSACRKAHSWIGDHPDEARKLGLLVGKGGWNKNEQ